MAGYNRQPIITPIHSDEVEKRLLDAADAIRRNAERGRTIRIRRAIIKSKWNSTDVQDVDDQETDEDDDLE